MEQIISTQYDKLQQQWTRTQNTKLCLNDILEAWLYIFFPAMVSTLF